MSTRPASVLAISVALVALLACDTGDPTRTGLGGGSAQLGADGYGLDWVGVYAGAGSGIVGTMNVALRDARLTIAPDAGAVRLPSCPGCVTITLDTLFAAVNVDLGDPQSVVVRQVSENIRRSLAMDRYSGAGGTANVVQARLTLDSIPGPASFVDVTYVFELR